MSYKLLSDGNILRLSDFAAIPNDPENADYREYLAMVETGYVPEPEFTLSELQAERSATVERTAREAVEEKEREARWLASPEKAAAASAATKINAAKTEAEIETAFAEAMK